jgi:Tfp pilus assembly protein PilF
MSSGETRSPWVRRSFSAAISIRRRRHSGGRLRDDPSSAEACYGLGSVYLKQEKAREARDSFERAVKLSASYPDTLPNAWNNLGLLATREGHIDEAAATFRKRCG